MIELFCGIGETTWNTIPVPEAAGPFLVAANCEKPVAVGNAVAMVDSGAFGDQNRLTFDAALARQYQREIDSNFTGHSFVAYDLLIDEKWNSAGIRHKCRWHEDEAETAVSETIAANEFLALQNLGPRRRVHPLQGVTAAQQEYCADAVIPMIACGDILGLGGWCIIGWSPPGSDTRMGLEAAFWDSAWRIIPKAGKAGIQHVHIFGVMVAAILGGLRWLCDEYGIEIVSTDSSGPQVNPAKYRRWGYDDWSEKCFFPPGPERGFARIAHVEAVRQWLTDFRSTRHYRQPPRPRGYQMRLF
jgi:hypothetical protein